MKAKKDLQGSEIWELNAGMDWKASERGFVLLFCTVNLAAGVLHNILIIYCSHLLDKFLFAFFQPNDLGLTSKFLDLNHQLVSQKYCMVRCDNRDLIEGAPH